MSTKGTLHTEGELTLPTSVSLVGESESITGSVTKHIRVKKRRVLLCQECLMKCRRN